MEKLQIIFRSGLLVLVLYLAIILGVLAGLPTIVAEAETPAQPAIIAPAAPTIEYARLTDALPRRTLAEQRLAPLEESK